MTDKITNITINIADTVPLTIYRELEHRHRLAMTNIRDLNERIKYLESLIKTEDLIRETGENN